MNADILKHTFFLLGIEFTLLHFLAVGLIVLGALIELLFAAQISRKATRGLMLFGIALLVLVIVAT